MCSSQPDCLDVVWNICVVPTPEEDRQGKGGVVGPQGCSERSPQFFHHCCCVWAEPGGQCEADAKCVLCVCVEGGGGVGWATERWRRESKTGTEWLWGAVSLVDDLWSWRLGLANLGAAGWGGERGVERSLSPNLRSTPPPPAAAAPQPSSLPVCVWCLFTSLFNHGAVPVVDWHKMTAA